MLYARVEVVTPPPAPVIGLAEMCEHLRTSVGLEDARIASLTVAAERRLGTAFGLSVGPQTLRVRPARFPLGAGTLPLPRAPLRSVSTFEYIAPDGSTGSLSAGEWREHLHLRPPRLALGTLTEWPEVATDRLEPIEITIEAGWVDAQAVPETVRLALKMMTKHLWLETSPYGPGPSPVEVPEGMADLLTDEGVPAWAGLGV